MSAEFSPKTRSMALERFSREKFDVLVIGGGITGAAVARECVSRGLSVALVERQDFSYGTSSRSSKLIHGGLRYLENLEFGLVFEALAERALLLKTVPHMVRPLAFYFPVYQRDRRGRFVLALGMWLYDLLSLFRAPGYHRLFSKKRFLRELPKLNPEGLKGGFRYYDASMWDDVLGIEILRDASARGAAVANYVEAKQPIFQGEKLTGFQYRDLETSASGKIEAEQVIVCAGPWTDELGSQLSAGESGRPAWRKWLKPSKGVHLIFDLKKLPLPGAMVMSQPEDGRISFVIPRPDFGAGVLVVGTTDGPTPEDPDRAEISRADVEYLLSLLQQYFPDANFQKADILSAYIGVRPLAIPPAEQDSALGAQALQKVSREHYIDSGPGGSVLVAGGKYTTHRPMAEEILEFACSKNKVLSSKLKTQFSTKEPINPQATSRAMQIAKQDSRAKKVEAELWDRYGAEALEMVSISEKFSSRTEDPEGFPRLEAQLRFLIRNSMVLHLDDFFFRRLPLFASRADHGLPWVDRLLAIWGEELGKSSQEQDLEKKRVIEQISLREKWRELFQ